MTDTMQPAARQLRRSYDREMEHLRESKRKLHIDDVDERHRDAVRTSVEKFIDDYYGSLVPDMAVEQIYVFGSYADGTAAEKLSDIDLRVILTTEFGQEQAEQLNSLMKNYVTKHACEGAPFGYVDPQCYPPSADMGGEGVVL